MFRGMFVVIAGCVLLAGGIEIIEIEQALYGCGVFLIMAEVGTMMMGDQWK